MVKKKTNVALKYFWASLLLGGIMAVYNIIADSLMRKAFHLSLLWIVNGLIEGVVLGFITFSVVGLFFNKKFGFTKFGVASIIFYTVAISVLLAVFMKSGWAWFLIVVAIIQMMIVQILSRYLIDD